MTKGVLCVSISPWLSGSLGGSETVIRLLECVLCFPISLLRDPCGDLKEKGMDLKVNLSLPKGIKKQGE